MRSPGILASKVLELKVVSTVVVLAIGAAVELHAQAPTCPCATRNAFGGCAISVADYPGQEPGSVAVVPVEGNRLVYVADRSDGFVYRYLLDPGGLVLEDCGTSAPTCFPAPLGSMPTPSGLVFNPDDGLLYWAIAGFLVRSIPDIGALDFFPSLELVSRVDLEQLAALLDLPQEGTLGAITFHATRNTFWGVDIVNDVYFEFGLDGKPVVEANRVVHFRSPAIGAHGAGAFGNDITYAQVAGVDYFDIAVGTLADGKATTIERVFADDGQMGGIPFTFGDGAGAYYQTALHLDDESFAVGIAYWDATCGAGQHAEVLLELSADPEEPSRVHLVSADAPVNTGLAAFACSASGNNVDISWKTFEGFRSLTVTRTDVVTGESREVISIPNGSGVTGERTAEDRNVADGTYEYEAVLVAANGTVYPARTCRVTVGRGAVVASVPFATSTSPQDTLPFAVTYIGSRDRVLVADFITGTAHLYDPDLVLRAVFPGPFHRTVTFDPGETTGVAWNATTDELIWTQYRGDGINFVQRTRLGQGPGGNPRIELIGEPVRIRNPRNLVRPILGDIAHDPVADHYWTADRQNGVAFSFRADGTLAGDSFTMQLPNPRTAGTDLGLSGGGLALVESTNTTLALDWGVGASDDDVAGFLDRIAYGRNFQAGSGDKVFTPGQRSFTVDLVTATGSRLLGGMVLVEKGEEQFEYVVAWDTGRVFKLDMSEGIAGKEFVRGDANGDGDLNVADPSFILAFLFKGGSAPRCTDAADVDDDERLNISDAVVLFRYLFMAGPPPPDPFEQCGRDFDDALICNVSTCG